MKKETQDQIEKEAYEAAKVFAAGFRNGTATNDEIREARIAYQEAWTACATKYTGKEEHDQNNLWREVIDDIRPFAKTNDEIERFKANFILTRKT